MSISIRLAAVVAALTVLGAFPLTTSAASAPPAGGGVWQVAGMVNVGEPTLRVVYDTTVPGSYGRAMQVVNSFRVQFSDLPQPGVITGLMQVGYSEHFGGVQVQVYSNNPYLGSEILYLFESYGIDMTACSDAPTTCPTWSAG